MLFRARTHTHTYTHNRTIDVASFPFIRSIQPTKRDNETADVTLVHDNQKPENRDVKFWSDPTEVVLQRTATIRPLIRIRSVLIYIFYKFRTAAMFALLLGWNGNAS
jgi:hypothetical protein